MPSSCSSSWSHTLSLTSPSAFDLAIVGGKGVNLARLMQANFPIPPGFILTTLAYREFLKVHQLEPVIQKFLQQVNLKDPGTLELVSDQIRARFDALAMPNAIADELRQRYVELGCLPVAVRSSATAEDLPEFSFAGQQDTFLNVSGEDDLIQAVVRCWSSLWTARAIGYRARNGMITQEMALAVVVQTMVNSQVSGVMFTANPVTGLRTETVIDAVYGLGEGLVSGRVAPDHYVVETGTGRLVEKVLGAKAEAARPVSGGGVAWVPEDAANQQTLDDGTIRALAEMGGRVAELYGVPQDIEWATFEGKTYLLQTRAVTSLFPIPDRLTADPLKVLFSFGAVQGMLAPITPFGRNMIELLFSLGAGLFGYRVTPETQTVLYTAGERQWVNITSLVRNTIGRKVMFGAFRLVEPTVGQSLGTILDDPRLTPERSGIRPQTALHLARFFCPLAFNALLNFLAPERRRKFILGQSEAILKQLKARGETISGDRYEKLAQRVDMLPVMAQIKLPTMFIRYVSGIAAGMASFNALNVLSNDLPQTNEGWHDLVMEVTRGLPNNPTTEMDLDLWQTAQLIRQDAASAAAFNQMTTVELAQYFQVGNLPEAAQHAVTAFMDRYGARGLGEIDTGRARWREDPTHILDVLVGYLQIPPGERAPDRVFQRGAEQAQAAVEALAAGVRSTRRGWLKARLVRLAAGRVRALMGIRESPKFFMVRMMGMVREQLLESGGEFAAAGELGQPDDFFYLTLSELTRIGAREPFDWREIITQRRAVYQRELQRRQIPRLLLSDGRAFYDGLDAQVVGEESTVMTGSPVSPGSVEGVVRVVLDPRQAHLLPGEILVCPGTDPSWTPLFLTAGGLLMEVGGMMTHGAVVAREYGIPAIVGVDHITRRLQTGQRVRINGSTGQIVLLS